VDAQNTFFKKCTHLVLLCVGRQETQSPGGMLKACYSYGLSGHATSE
jgi:hypothetical protein